MAKIMPRSRHPKKAGDEEAEQSKKKISDLLQETKIKTPNRTARLMFEDEIITHIPPYAPEMNSVEQIWKQIRQMGFGNKIFSTLNAVVDRLCDTINLLTDELVKSITLREWVCSII